MQFKLNLFEGPLDLLLRLIEKNEIDIYDIPVAALTDQYMAVITALPQELAIPIERGMDGMSEFLLMAATLLELKSRMLLPKPPSSAGDETDPREALVRQLLEYKNCQTMAEQLKNLPTQGERVVRSGEKPLLKKMSTFAPAQAMEGVPLEMLWHAFTEAIRRRELKIDHVRAGYGEMPRERFTVEEKISDISARLTRSGRFGLSDLFRACVSRGEMIVTFLALLEMIRQGLAEARQRRVFEDIQICACSML